MARVEPPAPAGVTDTKDLWTPDDVDKYGFQGWGPPDAGQSLEPGEFGGGTANNDGRFMESTVSDSQPGDPSSDTATVHGQQGAIAYLTSPEAKATPFSLFLSLVNPHDVLAYPKEAADPANGYSDASWTAGNIGSPATVDEDLATKPKVKEEFRVMMPERPGALPTPEDKRNYLNF